MPTIPLPEVPSAELRTAYCTVAEARAHGATGDDDTILADIGSASERVDKYTGELFVPTAVTVRAVVGGDGRAVLPHRIKADDLVGHPIAVTRVQDNTVVSVGTYIVSSSRTRGAQDFIGLGPQWAGYDLLVVGMEPYSEYCAPESIDVAATFGYDEPPLMVREATAILAAMVNRQRLSQTVDDVTTPMQQADPEGNVLPVVPPFTDVGDQEDPDLAPGALLTTGHRVADRLLQQYRRILLSAV